MKLVSVDKFTDTEREKLIVASRKARPSAAERRAFAKLRKAWKGGKNA